MKNDFLTIPDAPNYEINSDLVVRNKSTGRILSNYLSQNHFVCSLWRAGNPAVRSVSTLRRQAVENAKSSALWRPIPSLDYKYEISPKGNIRNARTKRTLKTRELSCQLYLNDKCVSRSINSLLWEVFGIVPKPASGSPVSVNIFKNGVHRFFPSIRKCAAFFQSFIAYSLSAIVYHLSKRPSSFFGWNISYF